MSEMSCSITLTVNGETVSETVEARKTLVDFLRDDLSLTGSHIGCEHGFCGACTVRVNGVIAPVAVEDQGGPPAQDVAWRTIFLASQAGANIAGQVLGVALG